MKEFKDFLYESLTNEDKVDELEKKLEKVEKKADDAEDAADKAEERAYDAEKQAEEADKEANKAEASIKDEKDFKSYAENKFKEVFGDKLDKDKMNEVVDGILKKYKEDADKGDWGKLVGVLNKSFGH